MGIIKLQIPDSLHRVALKWVKKENMSLDQFVELVLVEKISMLAAEDAMENRARRGNCERFAKAMGRVPDVEPEECDRL